MSKSLPSDRGYEIIKAILNAKIKVNLNRVPEMITIRKLIDYTVNFESAPKSDIPGVSLPTEARTALARHGILVDNGNILISNTHRAVRQLIKTTGCKSGWGRVIKLTEIASAHPHKKYFDGAPSRVTSIPYDRLDSIGDKYGPSTTGNAEI